MINKTILPVLIILVTLTALACEGPSGTEGGQEDEESVEVFQEEGVVTMVQILIDRGLVEDSSSKVIKTSSGAETSTDPVLDALEAEDYVSAEFNDQGTLMLRLWVSPDGELIPNGEWRDANPDACEVRLRYMKGGAHLLNFKVHASIREITAQFINIETGKIEKQQIGQGDGENWLREAIEDAWDQLNIQIKKAESPCGAKMRLDLILESRIKHEDITDDETIIFVSEVKSEIELEFVDVIELFDNDKNWYEGYGTLVYVEYTSSIDGSCTVSDGGQWGTFELTIPEKAENPVDGIEMRMDGDGGEWAECSESDQPVLPMWPFDFALLRLDGGELRTSTDPWHYLISEWEAVPDDSEVIARKVYDQTVTDHDEGETMILTEKTTIELRRRDE